MKKIRVLAAMSGGVDSSVTAALLIEQGYEVIGITMRLWEEETGNTTACCSFDSVQDARKVCYKLDIPHYTLNMKEKFQQCVVDDFVQEYQNGRTPNPCIKCNHWLKFDALLQKAQELDCQYIATGHYAKVEQQGNLFRLKKAFNPAKDQSYVLYTLSQQSLAHILLPLSDFNSKDEIRKIATDLDLLTANKPESQDICFIPNNDTKDFLLRQNPKLKKPGNIIFQPTGEILGKHEGIAFHTIGQRKGLGVAWTEPLYVVEIDPNKNIVYVATNQEVFKNKLIAEDITFVEQTLTKGETLKVNAKIRYSHKEAPATITMLESDVAEVVFQEQQRAITPGQAVVFYQDQYVIGGGIIQKIL